MLFRYELRRFRRGLPLLALLFILLVPAIYGALYLSANWDPYGAMDRLPVAIVNEDEPVQRGDTTLRTGADMTERLKDDRAFDWRETTREEAEEGLREGRYYLVLEIPAELSRDLVSPEGGGTPQQAQITLRRDDANGFVIGSVTASSQAKVEAAVNRSAIEAYFEAVFSSLGELRSGMVDAADGAAQLADGTASAEDGASQLEDGIVQAHDGSGKLAEGAGQLATGAGDLADGAAQADDGAAASQPAAGSQPGPVDENGHWVASAPQPDRSLLTPELRAKIDAIAVATLTAQLQKRGVQNATIDGPRPIHQGRRVLGYAKTLRYVPKREDLFKEFGGGFNAQKRAIDSVQPDDVVVMEARGEHGTGTLGDVLALRAQVNGANAVITDGGIRDSAAVAEVGLQVYAGATHPAVLGRRHIPWEVGGTIACGGTTVQPGDIIVGDDDGVVVIPPSLLQEVVDDAYEQELQDAWAYEQVKAGYPVDGMFPPNAEWKAKFAEYRKTLPDAPAPEGDA